MKNYIDPILDLGELLLTIEKPNRYIGGEYGLLAKKDALYHTVIAFPDLYEIGMSNKALRIIYNKLNSMEDISCDRVFSPALDFEALLRKHKIPLYGLETGINLKITDVLMFTLGYELGITNVLTILDLSNIPIHSKKRNNDHPIIFMGGPCTSNPLPYSSFIDCFWIGEAEDGFFELMSAARDIKKRGGQRKEILEMFLSHPSVWGKGKEQANRAIYKDFGNKSPEPNVFPVPVIKVVHQHGSIEIMRGCPNGCRFCHAGFWSRPMRQKQADIIHKEADAFINNGGYREISLSSLSSGDYNYIEDLLDNLNNKYKHKHVSFQLPSLKVSGFSLSLLEKISEVRKSGLTFAVETPMDFHQIAINKKVSLKNVIDIIMEAKKRGWRRVKFYFMVGLPLKDFNMNNHNEEEAIVDFITKASLETGMCFYINLCTFIPKPHTPFQWETQISYKIAEQKLNYIRNKLKPKGHKLGIQDPFVSTIEGIISRGNKKTSFIIEKAWKLGCRFDAWDNLIKKDIWKNLLKKNNKNILDILNGNFKNNVLPWNFIKSRINDDFLLNEKACILNEKITLPCIEKCNNHCGICNKTISITKNSIQAEANSHEQLEINIQENILNIKDPDTRRIIFSFKKQDKAALHSYLDLRELFSLVFILSGLPIRYSRGFNPLPVLEIVSPLSVGIKGANEIGLVELTEYIDPKLFKNLMNQYLIQGIEINECNSIYIPSGTKKNSLSAWLWGSVYINQNNETPELIPFQYEKAYKQNHSFWNLTRLEVLAKYPDSHDTGKLNQGHSYFDLFKSLYPLKDPTA